MKHIFIIGARGYHYNYGGWETFVTNLVDNYNDKNTKFYISELSDVKKKVYSVTNNIMITPFKVNINGGVKMLLCTMKAFNYYISYIEKNNLDNCYIYILGLKLGPLLKLKKSKLKSLGIKVFVNPDGLEHERSKWSYPVKKFFLLSEKWMLNNCDKIICDAKGIKTYINNKYPSLKNKTIYIAYGTNKIDLCDTNEETILDKYKLTKDNYILMVGRFVPENNFDMVINSFIETCINKKLVIISNISSNNNYYKKIIKETNCLEDKRIVFIDGIYNEKELTVIRKNAYAYIHGHSVGGTNPSLLEALNTTDINILYDVVFNKDVGGKSCLYFKNEEELVKIINSIEKYNKVKMGIECKKIIQNNFTWEIIAKKYEEIFK